jgi:hypothetical protein
VGDAAAGSAYPVHHKPFAAGKNSGRPPAGKNDRKFIRQKRAGKPGAVKFIIDKTA